MAKKFQELTIKDSFMFAAVMTDESICRSMLEVVLGMHILEVTVITEKTMDYHPDFHGVRLDVLAVENGTQRRFNVEMQVKRPKDIFRRCRFYHSGMDMNLLRGGIDYEILPDAYVIFICDFDPFEKGMYRYSCRMTCLETGEVVKDGSTTILLNTHGKNPQEISPELLQFLEYVKDPEVSLEVARDNRFINDLENCVAAVKQDRNWEVKYMQFREMLRDEHEEGLQEGLKEGRLEGETKILDCIRSLMKNLQWTSEQAMDALGLSAEDQQKYRGMV